MFLELMLFLFLGVFFGIISGLTPGIHVNLIAVLLLSLSPFLLKFTNVLSLAVFIVAMSVTHSFLDFIPSIFLGAPDSETALGVLPGHRYLLKGFGYMAVKLSIIGSFGALLLSILMFPLFLPLIKYAYPLIEGYIGHLLIIVVVFMVLRDRKRLWALFVFLLAGVYGVVVLGMPILKDPLFPMLSGLFGISTLIVSFVQNDNIPEQKISTDIKLKWKNAFQALFSGQFSGFLAAMLPGLGAAQSAVISMQITRKLGDHGFMILIGAISMVNFVLSFVTLYVLDKARNGSVVAISELVNVVDMGVIVIFLLASLVAGAISVFLSLKIGRVFSKFITKINYKKLVVCIIILVVVMVCILTGFVGFFVLVVGTAIGIIPAEIKVCRTHAMGCLMLPVILYFTL